MNESLVRSHYFVQVKHEGQSKDGSSKRDEKNECQEILINNVDLLLRIIMAISTD